MADGNSFVMMGLGDYRFGIATAAFQDLQRTTAWRWPTVERIGAAPASQYVGPGEETISLSGRVYPHFKGGLGQLDAMRAEAGKGEPLILVDGTGKVWGKYVITQVREGQSTFFSNGAPRCQEFDLSLQAYGDDQSQAAGSPIAAVASGVIPGGVPSLNDAIAALPSLPSLPDVQSLADGIAAKAALAMSSVRQVVGLTTSGLATVSSMISTGASILGGVENLAQAATAVTGSFDKLLSAGSLQAFAEAGVDVQAMIGQAQAAGTVPLNAILGALGTVNGAEALLTRTVGADAAKIYAGLIPVGGGNG